MIGIIFNPTANNGKTGKRMADFLAMLDSRNIEYEYRESQWAGHTIDLAKELSETCSTLVAAGGDGTFFEIITAVWDRDVRVAPLPFGSGNDSAMTIYGKDFPDERMVDIISGEGEIEVDFAIANDKYAFMLLASFGFGADVLKAYKTNGGSYAKVIPGLLLHCNRKPYIIKVNGTEQEYESEFVTMVNTGIAGGGMHILGSSSIFDGEMELVILEKSSGLRRMANYLALLRKKLEQQPNVKVIKFSECTIICKEGVSLCNIDGEMIDLEEINIRVLNKKLRVAQAIH